MYSQRLADDIVERYGVEEAQVVLLALIERVGTPPRQRQWRVSWQRASWAWPQQRMFNHRRDVDRHLAELRSGRHRDPVVWQETSVRDVGQWVVALESPR